jgi:uncharacterized protein (TIGR02246 family)
MKRMLIATMASLVVLAMAAMSAAAEDPSKDREKQEILKLVSLYQAAFNGGDAKAVAALYTPTGDYIGPRGDRVEGRTEIENQLIAFHAAHKGMKLAIAVTAIRLAGDDMAIVDAIPTTTPPLQSGTVEYRSTMILVRREGHWLIESARDTLNCVPSSNSHLKQIEWLVGAWADDAASSGGRAVASTCDWAADKSFLIRKITASLAGGTAGAGTEIIGWDPREHCIRSWDFDSDGAFGQSTWTRDGDRWIIQRTGVLSDGGSASATFVLTRLDPNTLGVQCRDRQQNGEKQPDVPEVKVRRHLPQPATGILPVRPTDPRGTTISP